MDLLHLLYGDEVLERFIITPLSGELLFKLFINKFL